VTREWEPSSRSHSRVPSTQPQPDPMEMRNRFQPQSTTPTPKLTAAIHGGQVPILTLAPWLLNGRSPRAGGRRCCCPAILTRSRHRRHRSALGKFIVRPIYIPTPIPRSKQGRSPPSHSDPDISSDSQINNSRNPLGSARDSIIRKQGRSWRRRPAGHGERLVHAHAVRHRGGAGALRIPM
jgi:hypothetical protein